MTGDAIAGRVVVPFTFPGEVPMVLDLDTAALRRPRARPRRAPGSRPAQAAGDPRRFSATWSSTQRSFGRVEAELSRGTAGITLNRFTMVHPAFSAEGRGSWLVRGDAAECRLDFDVETKDVKGFMSAMRLGTRRRGREGTRIPRA